jgi:DNA polymerase elongation subunit (family B)
MTDLGVYTSVETYGNNILYRGRADDGSAIRKRIPYCPSLFVSGNIDKPTKYKTIHGEPVHKMRFSGIREARDFVKQYENTQNFKMFGNTQYSHCFISDMFNGNIKWNIDQLRVGTIDIETTSKNGFPQISDAIEAITAITVRVKNKIYVFGYNDYVSKSPNIIYHRCLDEADMLEEFIRWWSTDYLDVLTGWNIRFFDVPYLINRMVRILGEERTNRLSPWGTINARDVVLMGKERRVYEIQGINVLDYLELFRKFDPKGTSQESYKLDDVAKDKIGRGKVKFDGSLDDLYANDFQTYIDYNMEDVNLVHDMNEQGRLIELALTLAYNAKVNISDVFYQTRMWDALIFNHIRQKNIVVPFKEVGAKDSAYDGAYVKNPLIGKHRNIASYDLTSLYPHLIMQYNISPETLVEILPDADTMNLRNEVNIDSLLERKPDLTVLRKHNLTLTPNGHFFRRDIHGFLPELMEIMFNQRKQFKDLMLVAQQKKEVETDKEKARELEWEIARCNNLQMAIKICLNSAYGAMGNPGFRFYDTRIALAITSSGQLSIRWIGEALNGYFSILMNTTKQDYIIASDTDSVYINLGPLIQSLIPNVTDTLSVINLMDKICKVKITPFINQSFDDLAQYVNAYAQKMEMKREALADVGVWVAKKRYLLNVWDSEGVRYKEPKIKISGLEAVRSSVPAFSRKHLKELYKIVLTKNQSDVHAYIEKVQDEFRKLPVEQIAFPRGVSSINKYSSPTSKAIPIHVRGSLVYNRELKNLGLEKIARDIKEGEKIRYVYLKEPNPYQSHVMAFPDIPPKELALDTYADYNMQFEKSFLDPARIVLAPLGWNTEASKTLEDLFG